MTPSTIDSQHIASIKETENHLIKFQRNMLRYYYSIESWNCFTLYHVYSISLHCWMSEYVSLFCFIWFASLVVFVTSHSLSKFKGSYLFKLIQFERTLMQRKIKIDGHFICCWIQFLVMVTRVFKITWEKSIKFILLMD